MQNTYKYLYNIIIPIFILLFHDNNIFNTQSMYIYIFFSVSKSESMWYLYCQETCAILLFYTILYSYSAYIYITHVYIYIYDVLYNEDNGVQNGDHDYVFFSTIRFLVKNITIPVVL